MPAETRQARAQRRERDRALMVSAVERLRGSDGWRAWLRARSRFRHYSLHNQLLIALQRPSATRVAGTATWRGLGYGVRRGESAIRIWAPCPPSRERIERWQGGGAQARDRPRTRFRLVAVFAEDQVEALPPPATPAPLVPPIAPIEGGAFAYVCTPLLALAAAIGYDVVVERLPDADGTCSARERRIAINATLAPNAQVAALIHELAHALAVIERGEDVQLSYARRNWSSSPWPGRCAARSASTRAPTASPTSPRGHRTPTSRSSNRRLRPSTGSRVASRTRSSCSETACA